MKENPESMAMKQVEDHIYKFIKQQRIIPAYDEFILEYVRDFCLHSNRELHIDSSRLTDIPALINHMQRTYPHIADMPCSIIHGHKEIRLNTLYDSLLFLQSRGYIGVTPVYPKRGHCANSGLVSDWFSPKLAFEKLQIVTTTVFSVYTDFISNNFPLLTSELDCYYGTNLVAVELEYIVGSMPSITMCFLKNQLPDNTRHIIFSWKGQSPLLKENGVDEYFKLWELPSLTYQGQSYTLARTQGCNTQKYLFDRYNFLSVFYDILKDQMETYFKSKLST